MKPFAIFIFLQILNPIFGQDILPPWYGSPTSQSNPILSQAALDHALELLERGELSHSGLDGRGVGDRLFDLGIVQGLAGEVIGAGPDHRSIWDAWWQSISHREILLDEGWEFYGAAEVSYSHGVILVITFFKKNS